MFKIDKTTWDVMQTKQNKVVIEDFSNATSLDRNSYLNNVKKKEKATEHAIEKIKDEIHKDIGIEDISTQKHLDKIISEAQKEFDLEKAKIETNAEKLARQIEDKAYQKGYNDCAEKTNGSIEFKINEIIEKQNRILSEINEEVEKHNNEVEKRIFENIIELSLTIAKKILGYELEKTDAIVNIVKKAIMQADGDQEITVKLNMKDYKKILESNLAEECRKLGYKSVNFTMNSAIRENGCIVETQNIFIDAGVGTQVKEIGNTISKKIDNYDEKL